MLTAHQLLLGLLGLSSVLELSAQGVMATWPDRVISWWYAADNDWPLVISQINHADRIPLVTSIQTYCGWDISDSGTIIGGTSAACTALFPELIKLGVRVELATGAGNCSIATYRKLWADTSKSPQVLLAAALAANASGWNIDLEPQANNCKGGPGDIGNKTDATLFASWLSAVRAVLNPHGIRLTVDVASWSPVLREFATLAPAVDRLQNMETYNGDSETQWLRYFNEFVMPVPLRAAGVGLGGWDDSKGGWWETEAGATSKVSHAIKAGVPELAVFRLVPSPEVQPEWPLSFWWDALAPFVGLAPARGVLAHPHLASPLSRAWGRTAVAPAPLFAVGVVCNATDTSQTLWEYDPLSEAITARTSSGVYCLSSSAGGKELSLVPCMTNAPPTTHAATAARIDTTDTTDTTANTGDDDEIWIRVGNTFRTLDGRCLTLDEGGAAAKRIGLATCTSAPDQQFSLNYITNGTKPIRSFRWTLGAMLAGGDRPGSPRNLTVSAAKALCAADSLCEGFTYHSGAKIPNGTLPIYLKSTPEANTDAAWSHYMAVRSYTMQMKVDDGYCVAARAMRPHAGPT